MLASLPSMGHVLLLLGMLFYVYGIIGNHFFAPFAWIYFISFVVLNVFVVINLFIAVVTNNLQAVKAEEHKEQAEDIELLVTELKETIEKFDAALLQLRQQR